MTTQEKIIALAKLDGWEEHPQYHSAMIKYNADSEIQHETSKGAERLTRYLTSYDAIIPLVQKMDRYTREKIDSVLFVYHHDIKLDSTPSEIADALLRAKGYEV